MSKPTWLVSETPGRLILTARREQCIGSIIGLLAFNALAWWCVYRLLPPLYLAMVFVISGLCLLCWKWTGKIQDSTNKICLLLFLFWPTIPAGLVALLAEQVRILVLGDVHKFDKDTGWLTRNEKRLVRLSEIKEVGVVQEVILKKHRTRRETNGKYFWLVLSDEHKIDISSEDREVEPLASMIATFLGCPLSETTVTLDKDTLRTEVTAPRIVQPAPNGYNLDSREAGI